MKAPPIPHRIVTIIPPGSRSSHSQPVMPSRHPELGKSLARIIHEDFYCNVDTPLRQADADGLAAQSVNILFNY